MCEMYSTSTQNMTVNVYAVLNECLFNRQNWAWQQCVYINRFDILLSTKF